LGDIWSGLDDSDHWTRYAARVELEMRPAAEWRERALTEERPTAALTALLALARVSEPDRQQPSIHHSCAASPVVVTLPLLGEQTLIAVRAHGGLFYSYGQTRRHPPGATWRHFGKRIIPLRMRDVNQALCELLVYLGSSKVIAMTLPLIDRAKTQEEKLHYLFTLRLVKSGWTLMTAAVISRGSAARDENFKARNVAHGAKLYPSGCRSHIE
jgi:hypothetical protein